MKVNPKPEYPKPPMPPGPPTTRKDGWKVSHHNVEDLQYIEELESEVQRLWAVIRGARDFLGNAL